MERIDGNHKATMERLYSSHKIDRENHKTFVAEANDNQRGIVADFRATRLEIKKSFAIIKFWTILALISSLALAAVAIFTIIVIIKTISGGL